MPTRPNVEDDEAFARMLQFEEQSKYARVPSETGAYSNQELSDLALAKELVRMEMEGQKKPSVNDPSHSSSLEQPSTRRSRTRKDPPPHREEMNVRSSSEENPPVKRSSSSPGSHRRNRSLDEPFEYARRLQEQAFRDLERRVPDPVQQSDIEIARRMQDLEDRGLYGGLYKSVGEETTMPVSDYASLTTAQTAQPENNSKAASRFMSDVGMASRPCVYDTSGADRSPTRVSSPSKLARLPISDYGVPRRVAGNNASFSNVGPPNSPAPPSALAARSAPTTPDRNFRPQIGDSTVVSSPGVPLLDPLCGDAFTSSTKGKKKTLRNFLGFGGRSPLPTTPTRISSASILSIPPPPGGSISAPPSNSPRRAVMSMRPISPIPGPRGGSALYCAPISPAPTSPMRHPGTFQPGALPSSSATNISKVCTACGKSGGKFLSALDRKYHVACFRCITCGELIDPSVAFSFSQDEHGRKQPHHRHCYAQAHSVKCSVCKQTIRSLPGDRTVCFVKHPFFDSEQMCPFHAELPTRRCTGCHRFEPESEPFADLHDANRCVCLACCRTVVVDNSDVEPLWQRVLSFFEISLQLPVWKQMREIPILVVESDALNDHLDRGNSAHKGASQIMARGLCLTDHDHARCFKLPSLRFEKSNGSFEARDVEERGFTYYEVPEDGPGNPDATVFAILCLSGLPRDLTTSILAHEATHAWIKLHPNYDARKPLPAQVEEGCSQLVAMLLLTDGLDPPDLSGGGGDDSEGPSDEKLRQYFKFSIERDDDEVYGAGYRKAAAAYSNIGIEALLSHVIRYREFPST